MKEQLEAIRQALVNRGALDPDALEALETLESSLESIQSHPDGDRVSEVVRLTAGSLSAEENAAGGLQGVSAKWQDLKDGMVHWEEEHPRLVMAVGRISDALAAVGL